MALAVSGAVRVSGVDVIRAQLPAAALKRAIEETDNMYSTPSALAVAQTKSQVCSPYDPGYAPPDRATAIRMLSSELMYVTDSLRHLTASPPCLAGSNMDNSSMHQLAQQLDRIADAVPDIVREQVLGKPIRPVYEVPSLQMSHMDGLNTFPYVASAVGGRPLDKRHRADLIVSGQLMVAGMGSVYMHDARREGYSYRPTGGLLFWQDRPAIMLNATFNASVSEDGQEMTKNTLRQWATGDPEVFTAEAVRQAKSALRERVLLMRMNFDSLKSSMMADMDPRKLSTKDILQAFEAVELDGPANACRLYFGDGSFNESWVKAT